MTRWQEAVVRDSETAEVCGRVLQDCFDVEDQVYCDHILPVLREESHKRRLHYWIHCAKIFSLRKKVGVIQNIQEA